MIHIEVVFSAIDLCDTFKITRFYNDSTKKMIFNANMTLSKELDFFVVIDEDFDSLAEALARLMNQFLIDNIDTSFQTSADKALLSATRTIAKLNN